MTLDLAALNLDTLFVDPAMFDLRRALAAAGFDVLPTENKSEVMVAAHPSAPGLLFKKYSNDVPLREQNENLQTRVEGARRVAEFIDRERLQHVVVPRKRLVELPRRLQSHKDASYVLVVERLDLLRKDESLDRYHDIEEPVLRELLVVLFEFKGLDSNVKNVPFTTDGRIAFVDLEHWDRRRDQDRPRLKQIGDYLSKKRHKRAKKILDDLEDHR